VLSAAETEAAEALLAAAWGTRVTVRSAGQIWGRRHIARLRLDSGASVVLKRRGPAKIAGSRRGFGADLAALEFLSAEETGVAPRLIGASTEILLMEDLGPSSSLAHSLLAGDRARAEADLIAYGRALGTMHGWSIGRAREFAALRARHAPSVPAEPELLDRVPAAKDRLLAVAARLGLPSAGAGDEIDSLGALLRDSGPAGLVHGDPCPDNTHIAGGNCRIFDFETSGWGPIALDAVYLLAPFPSCWCFASLPASAAGPALEAYRDQLARAGIDVRPSWDAAVAAALAGWVVARGAGIGRALEEDRDWGTATMRPRLLTWLRTFTDAASQAGVLPRLRSLAEALHTELGGRWPSAVVPSYPALAAPGAPLARRPREWPSSG
jgi:hypothetical protein